MSQTQKPSESHSPCPLHTCSMTGKPSIYDEYPPGHSAIRQIFSVVCEKDVVKNMQQIATHRQSTCTHVSFMHTAASMHRMLIQSQTHMQTHSKHISTSWVHIKQVLDLFLQFEYSDTSEEQQAQNENTCCTMRIVVTLLRRFTELDVHYT